MKTVSCLCGLDQAIAVRNHGGIIIAQVKRVTANGSLRPHDVYIPGNLIDLIVVDPDRKQTTETDFDPAISGVIMRLWPSFALAEYGLEKVIARRAAMELRNGQSANIGFGISANVPRVLLEEGHEQAVAWAIEQGAVGGMPLTGFAFGCSSNADSILPSPAQFTYFQGDGFVDITSYAKKCFPVFLRPARRLTLAKMVLKSPLRASFKKWLMRWNTSLLQNIASAKQDKTSCM